MFTATDRVEYELGPIDIWVNDAFTSVFSRFEQFMVVVQETPSNDLMVAQTPFDYPAAANSAALVVAAADRQGQG